MVRPHVSINLSEKEIETVRSLERSFAENGQHRWADRCRAILFRASGYGLEETCRIINRPNSTVKDWNRAFHREGISSLIPKTSTRGRKPKLGQRERNLLAKAIERGPKAAGYHCGVWTSLMISDYILKRWNVDYHPAHVRKILHQLGFSVQCPREKLALADKNAQKKWVNETYPDIKKTRK